MAFRTWAKLLGATLGVGALAGASQLGLAYGLGILRLTRVVTVTTRDQWTAQLAWVAWFAMAAAVIGALVGRTFLPTTKVNPKTATPRTAGAGTRIALALAAGAGAAVVVPLTMQPARTAQIDGVHPVFVIGICAGLGAIAGVFAAYSAVTSAVARWGLITVGAAVWVIALASVAPSLAPSDPLPAARLGVFDAGFLTPAVTQRTALFTMPALALVSGAILGWAARRRELPILTIALAGLPGPALLTVAYLIAGPGSGQDRYQVVPYWAAMTAAGAGVLGSVLAAVLRRGPATEPPPDNDPTSTSETTGRTSTTGKPETTGTAGTFGEPGTTGRPGTTGTAGTFGNTGATGTAGAFGTADTAGSAGVIGTTGTAGTAGPNGAAGATGTIATVDPAGTAGTAGTADTAGKAGRGWWAGRSRRAATSGKAGPASAEQPTPDRPPLPRRDIQTESAIAQAAAAAAQRPEDQLRPSDTGIFTRPEPAPKPVAPKPVQTMTRPEPQVISPPLPDPKPVPRTRGKKDQNDGEFVDWVNGLSND